ncbi:hypothetical protein, partial [Accumulibacter sp.]|uniref:hypothetical protein n=1 Tax=Accumulibacter sp. TaxID=2053492 RepID=UPI0028C50693
ASAPSPPRDIRVHDRPFKHSRLVKLTAHANPPIDGQLSIFLTEYLAASLPSPVKPLIRWTRAHQARNLLIVFRCDKGASRAA